MARTYVRYSDSDSTFQRYARELRRVAVFDPSNRQSWVQQHLHARATADREYLGANLKTETMALAYANLAIGADAKHPRLVPSLANSGILVELRTNEQREGYALANARFAARQRYLITAAVNRGRAFMRQIDGVDAVTDDAGNALSGTAARNARIDLLNHWYCQLVDESRVDGKTRIQRRAEAAEALAAEETARLSDNLEIAKQELMDRHDGTAKARCVHLFGVSCGEPLNQWQMDAWYKIGRERQKLGRSLAAATTAAAAETAAAASAVAVNAVGVEHAPTWQDEHGEPQHGEAISSAYTKGRGAAKWKLNLHAFSTGKSTNSVRADTYGPCWMEPFENADFEVVPWNKTGAIRNDLYVRVQRKTGASGHPASGPHEFKLTARNFNGPTTLTVTVTVP